MRSTTSAASADHQHASALGLHLPHAVQFLFRQQLGLDVRDADFTSHRLGGAAAIAGQQNNVADSQTLDVVDGLRGPLARRVAQQDCPHERVVARHQDRRRAGLVGGLKRGLRVFHSSVGNKGLVSRADETALDLALGAAAGDDAGLGRRRDLQPALGGGFDDDFRERMVGPGLGRRAHSQDFVFVVIGRSEDFENLETARGQRARLIEDDRVDLRAAFEDRPAANEDSPARQASDRRHHGRRRGQDQSARAADDQDGDGTHPIGSEIVGSAGGQQQCRQEVLGVAVGGAHHRGAVLFRFANQLDDARQRRVLGRRGNPYVQQPVAVQRARVDFVALGFLPRQRFPRDRAFVDARLSARHHPVRRDSLSGPDDDQVADLEVLNVNILLDAVAQPARGVRQLLDKALDRRFGSPGRISLQALADKHDEHRLGGDQDSPTVSAASTAMQIATSAEILRSINPPIVL